MADVHITEAKLTEAAEAGFNEDEIGVARLALRRFAKKGGPDAIQENITHCAIRRVKQGGGPNKDVRPRAETILEWKSTIYQSVEVSTEYFIVPKKNAHLWCGSPQAVECLVPPEDFEELPDSVGPTTRDIFDDWAPRNDLGPGVRRMKAAEGATRKRKPTVPSQPASALARANETPDEWAAKTRKLFRRPSDAHRKLQDAMEGIAKDIDEAFTWGNFSQPDPMAPSAECWCRKFKDNLLAQWAEWKAAHPGGDAASTQKEFHAAADPFTQGLLGFIVQNLVARPAREHPPRFAATLKAIKAELPCFVDALGDAVLQLGDLRLDTAEEVDTSRLTLEDIAARQTSALVKQVVRERWLAKLDRVKTTACASISDKLKDIDVLRKSQARADVPKERLGNLEVARDLLGPASIGAKMKCLLQDPKRFDAWAEWAPKDQALYGKPFASKENVFKGTSVKEFPLGALQIPRGGVDCSEDVAQPIAKDMVVALNKHLTFGDARVDTGSPEYAMVKAVYCELVCLKLGAEPESPPMEWAPESAKTDLGKRCLKNMSKVLGAQMKKLSGDNAGRAKSEIEILEAAEAAKAEADKKTAEAAEAAKAAEAEAERAKAEAAAAEAEAKKAEDAAAGAAFLADKEATAGGGDSAGAEQPEAQDTAGADKAGSGAPPAAAAKAEGGSAQAPGRQGAGAPPPARALAVGDVVLTSSGTHKAEHDNKKAEVIKIGARPVVEFLEGGAVGETKEFDKSKLTLLDDAPAAKPTPTVPPAGVGAQAAHVAARAERAKSFFGKVAAVGAPQKPGQ
ncbi:unnamed protein product, partial [Prorocentrum cordatum]